MLLEQNSEIKLMQVLAKYWYKQFSVYELAREAKVTAPMAYKALEKFSSKGLIVRQDNRVKINFNNYFSYRFKLLSDAERFLSLSKDDQEKSLRILQVMESEYSQQLLAVVLFGSTAAGEKTTSSDLDVMVIVNQKKEVDYEKRGFLSLGKINIIEIEKKEFENDYLLAHDLVLGALMNGIILSDAGIFRLLLSKPLPSPSLEVILQKQERLGVLKKRLFFLLKDGDYVRLTDEFKQYLMEKGRILMLQRGLIPTSKTNIILQLRKIDKEAYLLYSKVNHNNVKLLVLKNVR